MKYSSNVLSEIIIMSNCKNVSHRNSLNLDKDKIVYSEKTFKETNLLKNSTLKFSRNFVCSLELLKEVYL